MFDFNSKYLQTKERIGSSATSTVYAYNEENNLDKCVVKHIQVNSSGELRKQMNNVVLGSNHDHPYIIPIKYCIQEEGKDNWDIYIKMPRMKGNLKEMLDEYKKSKKGVFPKDQVIQYLFCLASGLEYLERKGICHGNIKPSNLLVDKSGKAYLSDIKMDKGEDTSTDKNANIPGGNKDTLMYLAPEVFNRKSGHRKKDDDIGKSDAWSLGIVMLELCTNISVENMMSMPEKEKRSVIAQALIEIETNYGEELSNILSGLLSIELNQRKSFSATRKALMEHFPSITEVIQKDIEHKLMNILDSGNKKIISREAIKESGSKECDHDNQRLVEKMEFYIKSWKLWIIPAFLGLILGISMACTIFLPMTTVPVVQYIKTADEGTSRVLETECPIMNNYEIIDDDDPGVDIFVEFPDSDEEAEDFDEPQFNNTADAMKAKWGQYFDFLEDNETLYIAPIDTSKIYDDTVNNLLIDLSETRKLFNPESLEKIDFDLSWCTEITDGTIKYLAFHFSHYLKELKSLRMIFWKCDQITDDGLEMLGEIITKNLKKLETIKLDFEGCSQIGDTGVATLGYHLKQRPEKIKALSLNFRACPRISDAGIGHLGYHLSFFTNLEELRLPISSCPRISDEGVKQISTYIGQNLVKLKLLVFNVGRSGLITDRGLGYFSWNIFKNLKDLEELWMNFEYSAITDEGIQQLSSSISQHGTGIQKLDLRFSGIIFYSCSRLKEEGFKNLGLGIGENLKDLKLLKLYVGKDKLISEEVKKQVREALSFIPELECVGCE